MQFTAGDLNRTLLARQHLLERTTMPTHRMVRHLVGLQAQENLSPFLSLAARLDVVDPYEVTRGLVEKSLVRLLCLRGTIHLLAPEDALSLRTFTQPAQNRERRSSQQVAPALHLDTALFNEAVSAALAHGPLPGRDLGLALAEVFPGVPPTSLTYLARVNLPLAQLPPRGAWKASGGVVYEYVDRWLGAPIRDPDLPDIVRRYLRAFGPATAADVTTWSGVTRLGAVLKSMDDLVTHTDESGRTLFDVPEAPVVTAEHPAPVRLLGTYDNVWLSHAARDRVTRPRARRRWMGPNGAAGRVVLIDGWLEGLWRAEDGKVQLELFRDLTGREAADLAAEIERTEAFLAR